MLEWIRHKFLIFFKAAVSNTRPAGRMWPARGACAAHELSQKLLNCKFVTKLAFFLNVFSIFISIAVHIKAFFKVMKNSVLHLLIFFSIMWPAEPFLLQIAASGDIFHLNAGRAWFWVWDPWYSACMFCRIGGEGGREMIYKRERERESFYV